jgi:hypothetical protein
VKRNEANAARGFAAGILEIGHLRGEVRLTRSERGDGEREGVIEHARGDLQPLRFVAAKLLEFEPQILLFVSVEALGEFHEIFGVGLHALFDFLGGLRHAHRGILR